MAPVSLLSTSKSSDTLIQVQLHPLVILTISDYITRHILRHQEGPIVGAIIGAQNGRDVTMEHAFECKMVSGKGGDILIDNDWFQARIQQYRDVHKAASLDLVGWFTLTPSSGPEPYVLPIHTQILQDYNESALLLSFHPQSVAAATSSSGKLPLTIYESAYESSTTTGNDDDGDDKHMQNTSSDQQGVLRFKEVPYTIETGDAEMIAVDFVARGGGNASAPEAPTSTPAAGTSKNSGKTKPKSNQTSTTTTTTSETTYLSASDEDLIALLTTKANAIRMLRQRLALLDAYLTSIPTDSYLVTRPTSTSASTPMIPSPAVSHAILRSIASLLSRLPLLLPSLSAEATITATPRAHEAAAERTDVALTTLLGSMGSTLRSAQSLGRKVGVVESARNNAKGKGGVGVFNPMLIDSMMDVDRGVEDGIFGGRGGGDRGGSSGFGGGGSGISGGGFGGFGGVFNSGGGGGSSRPPVDIGALLAGQGRRG